MDNKINLQTLITRLEENNLPYGILPLQNNIKAVITQRGGRIFLFPDDLNPGLLWTNQAFNDPDTFKEFLLSGHWNLGGDRIWIAPEVQYSISDRDDFNGSFHLQEEMDPGHYHLNQLDRNIWHLHQDFSMQAHILASGRKDLEISRVIRPVEDPIRCLDGYNKLIEGVNFAGYEQAVTLEEKSSDDIVSEVWSLIQLNPGGMLFIPVTGPVEYTDYLNPVDQEHFNIYPHYVSLKITGDHHYKHGYKSPCVTGRLAYLNRLDADNSYLIVRNFYNNPSAHYSEEAAHLPDRRGHSVHVYNDDGALGGFGELECNGQTIGGSSGRSKSLEQLVLWIYMGRSSQVKEIAKHLLGIEV